MHVWAIGLWCETKAASGPPGASHDSPRTPNVHISGPRRFQTPPKNHEKTPRERDKKSENGAVEGKKARNFGLPTLRSPTLRGLRGLRGPTFFCLRPPPSWPTLRGPTLRGPTLGAMTHTRSRNWLAQIGLAQIGLATIGFGQNWPGQNQDGQKWIGQNWSNQDDQNGIGQSRSLPFSQGPSIFSKWPWFRPTGTASKALLADISPMWTNERARSQRLSSSSCR